MVMIFTLLPMNAFAADVVSSGTCGGNLTWTLDSEGTLTISGTGAMDDYSNDVAPWYDKTDEIETVVIESGVTSIGDCAFNNCDNLTSVTIPDSVTTIGEAAFFNCSSLTSVTIPNSVTTIGKEAFRYCSSLTSVTIPDSVKSIGEYAFLDCSRLTGIWVDDANAKYSSDEHGVLFNKDKTELICCPGGYDGPYTIPGSVTSIGDFAFSRCSNLTSVTIGSGVTSIGGGAFYGCSSLTSVTIPNSVTSIGDFAFERCSSLTSVTIPNSVTTIGDYAFKYCSSLTSINVDNNNEYYSSSGGVLFDKNQTILICYPAGKTESNYTIPDSVTYIDVDAFYQCINLKSVTIPDSVTSIGDYAFSYCSLTSVIIPDSVKSIGEGAFGDCSSLTSVIIPDSVKSIGDYAFYSCNGLTSVTIGSGVTTIGDHAFSFCSSLTSVTIPDSVISIGSNAFSYCDSLQSVAIPDSVTSIGGFAFSDCYSLTSVTIGSGVTSIGDLAFSYCSSLTSITIPDSVTSIGYKAFYFCSSLTDVYYAGTEAEWNAISIESNNDYLTNASIHYNSAVTHEHSYTSAVTEPTCTEKGYTTHTCACGDSYKDSYVNALGHNFKNGACTRCGEKDPDYEPTAYPFTDVDVDGKHKPFAGAILWAADEGITTGYGNGIFKPDADCTRAQVVTFLWRAAGEPAPKSTSNPFADVSAKQANGKDNPYYTAILWAVGEGITLGVDKTHFAPDATVTRAQFVTFLWRYENKPAAKPGVTLKDLGTVTNADFKSAILWAAGEGITTGYGDGSFRPNAVCTRAYVVTFIYRDMAE